MAPNPAMLVRVGGSRGRAAALSASSRRWMVGLAAAVVLSPRPALAHGAGTATDGLSTALLIGAGAVVWWFKTLKSSSEPFRRLRWGLVPAVGVLVIAALTATLWGPKPKPAKIRPVTAARLAILEPHPNAVTGPDVTVRLRLEGGRIVPQTQANGLVPDGGHVHTYVDGRLVSMVDGLEQVLHGLAPGPHTVRTEFVAADHGSFKNPVVAAVVFQVGG